MRIRISNSGKFASELSYEAYIPKLSVRGSIDKTYINKKKQKEVFETSFAYVNQPKERVV